MRKEYFIYLLNQIKGFVQLAALCLWIFTFQVCGTIAQEKCLWPCFHGPERTNKSDETGLLEKWPEGGPRLLWKVAGIGEGYSSVSIAERYIFTSGMVDGKTHVFASSGYGRGSILLKINVSGNEIFPETVWQTELMDNHHGGVIMHNGYFYGAGHNKRGWFCLDFHTGEQVWKAQGKGSLTYADNMLYCLEERGIMTLVIVRL